MTTLHLGKSIGPAVAGRGCLLIGVALACFALSRTVQAVLPSPTPDGGYPGGNTAEGNNALFSLTSGLYNTAVGDQALYHLTTGNSNTAIGFEALHSSLMGHANTANGYEALYHDTIGSDNTAIGFGALVNNITGDGNTATGYLALVSNTIGGGNTASGLNALYHNISGNRNTATGQEALFSNTNGEQNTAIGYFALNNNTTGNFNIALGNSAGKNLTTGHFNIDIGNEGVAGESDVIRIGREGIQTGTHIAGIFNEPVTANNLPVLIDSTGKLGTTVASSRRFKKEIKAMEKVSEAILALKPVTFYYKDDKADTPQFGLIAEEVAKVNPKLVLSDTEGKPYTVRYDAVNAMLLNEFLKEHKAFLAEQRKVEHLEKQVEALSAGLQKVTAQLEVSKPEPRTVLNDQ